MSEEVEVDFDDLKHQTDAAYLIVIDEKEIWLPKQHVHIDTKAHVATMPEWLATEKELI